MFLFGVAVRWWKFVTERLEKLPQCLHDLQHRSAVRSVRWICCGYVVGYIVVAVHVFPEVAPHHWVVQWPKALNLNNVNIVRMCRNLSKTVICPSVSLYACHGFQSVTGARKCEILKHDSPHHTHPARPGGFEVVGKLDDLPVVHHPLSSVDCPSPSMSID